MTDKPKLQFISEAIKPVAENMDTKAMANGAPGLPSEFIWNDKPLSIASVIREWKDTSPCKHGSTEQYVRKHCFEVATADGLRAKIYFERQSRGRNNKQRWWLHSIEKKSA